MLQHTARTQLQHNATRRLAHSCLSTHRGIVWALRQVQVELRKEHGTCGQLKRPSFHRPSLRVAFAAKASWRCQIRKCLASCVPLLCQKSHRAGEVRCDLSHIGKWKPSDQSHQKHVGSTSKPLYAEATVNNRHSRGDLWKPSRWLMICCVTGLPWWQQ